MYPRTGTLFLSHPRAARICALFCLYLLFYYHLRQRHNWEYLRGSALVLFLLSLPASPLCFPCSCFGPVSDLVRDFVTALITVCTHINQRFVRRGFACPYRAILRTNIFSQLFAESQGSTLSGLLAKLSVYKLVSLCVQLSIAALTQLS